DPGDLADGPAVVATEPQHRSEGRALRWPRMVVRPGRPSGGLRLGRGRRRCRGTLGCRLALGCTRVAARSLDVVLASAPRIAQDLPRGVDLLHLVLVAEDIRMEDLGKGAIGGLDHERVRGGIDLQDAVEIGACAVHDRTMPMRARAVKGPRVRFGAVPTATPELGLRQSDRISRSMIEVVPALVHAGHAAGAEHCVDLRAERATGWSLSEPIEVWAIHA